MKAHIKEDLQMYELDGQRLKIYNGTDEIVADLYFVLPGTDIVSNVKKIKPNMHEQEHIFSGYKGDLTFYFKHNEGVKYTFENVIGIPEDLGVMGNDFTHAYSLQFRIVKKDNQTAIIQEEYVD